jgi:hypothetical protein
MVLRYIELKSGYNDNGPAWIARVKQSKSGRTVYFADRALKRATGGLSGGNHYDLVTGDSYWVSGVKTRGSNRHRWGSGLVLIEAGAVLEYLRLVGESALDTSRFRVINDFPEPEPAKFVELENRELDT